MATGRLEFYEIPLKERGGIRAAAEILGRGDAGDRCEGQMELAIVAADGSRRSVQLPESAATVARNVLIQLSQAVRIALVEDDIELSPEQAATLLSISRPLVVERMKTGALPFRYVGSHRRCRLSDVLRLREQERAAGYLPAPDVAPPARPAPPQPAADTVAPPATAAETAPLPRSPAERISLVLDRMKSGPMPYQAVEFDRRAGTEMPAEAVVMPRETPAVAAVDFGLPSPLASTDVRTIDLPPGTMPRPARLFQRLRAFTTVAQRSK